MCAFPRPLEQHGEVDVSGDMMAEIFVDEGEGSGQRNVDVRLFSISSGEAFDDADVRAETDSGFIEHGGFSVSAEAAGEGHYLLPLRFTMPGEWAVDVIISRAGETSALRLNFDLFE